MVRDAVVIADRGNSSYNRGSIVSDGGLIADLRPDLTASQREHAWKRIKMTAGAALPGPAISKARAPQISSLARSIAVTPERLARWQKVVSENCEETITMSSLDPVTGQPSVGRRALYVALQHHFTINFDEMCGNPVWPAHVRRTAAAQARESCER